jgi:DDE superfamily endonuclease
MGFLPAWMDEQGMLEWIRVVWTEFVESVGGPTTTTYLLMDTFLAHRTKKVRHALASLRTIVDFVPPHCTSKLQVCDVSVNAPLSASIHTKGKVTPDIIMNGFKKIGIYYPKSTNV